MQVLQLSYLLHPVSAEAWMFVRTSGILYYPLCFSMLLPRYFRGEKLRQLDCLVDDTHFSSYSSLKKCICIFLFYYAGI